MQENKRFAFTKKAISDLGTSPAGKRAIYYDTRTRGFAVRVTDTGKKTFVLYRRINGKPSTLTIGRFPDLKVGEARDIADKWNGLIARKVDPRKLENEAGEKTTLGQLFEEYLDRYAKENKKSWEQDEGNFDRHLTDWKSRELADITKQEVLLLHSKIGKKNGHYMANRILALVHCLFGKAEEWGYFEGGNPARGVKKFREKTRERYLHGEEMTRFFEALDEVEDEDIRDFVFLALLTGARRNNILEMRFEQLDLSGVSPMWTIPDTKGGRPLVVPLLPEAVEIVKRRRAEDAKASWVFPGPGRSGHWEDPKRAWHRLLEKAEIKGLRIHDLRRTLGSWQASTGASLQVIGKTLGHRNPTTTMVYSRLDLDPVRAAMETATEAMFRAGGLIRKNGETDGKEE